MGKKKKIKVGDEKYDGEGFKLAENGTHLVFVSEAKCEESSGGNDMLVCEFVIHGTQDIDRGRKIRFQYYVWTPDARWKIIDLLRAIDPEMEIDITDQDDVDELVLGKPLALTTKQKTETWEDEERVKIQCKDHRMLTKPEKKALKKAYGKSLVPEDGEVGSSGSSGAGEAGQIPEDDDIPF